MPGQWGKNLLRKWLWYCKADKWLAQLPGGEMNFEEMSCFVMLMCHLLSAQECIDWGPKKRRDGAQCMGATDHKHLCAGKALTVQIAVTGISIKFRCFEAKFSWILNQRRNTNMYYKSDIPVLKAVYTCNAWSPIYYLDISMLMWGS